MTRKPTIYEALKASLGREPSAAELRADVQRIIRAGYEQAAACGKLAYQRRA